MSKRFYEEVRLRSCNEAREGGGGSNLDSGENGSFISIVIPSVNYAHGIRILLLSSSNGRPQNSFTSSSSIAITINHFDQLTLQPITPPPSHVKITYQKG